MKRVISAFLIISFILSFGAVAYAISPEQETNVYHYNLLKELKIVDKAVSKDYDPFADVSKSAFINYVCNIIGDCGYDNTYNEVAIAMLESNGIIHPNQDDLTKPLYLDEAVTMLVRLLGYEQHAQMAGGYPTGYLMIASRLGLTDGLAVNPGERLKESNMITLLYNAINACYVEIVSISAKDGIIYGNTSDNTLLYEYRKVYRVDGVVETAGGISLKAFSELEPDKIMIDGYVYETEYDYSKLLGLRVEAYVQEGRDGIDKVIAACSLDNKTLEIQGEYITGISENYTQLSYMEENNKIKKVSLSPVASIIYNGQLLGEGYSDDKFMPADGKITLIDNTYGEGYDVAFIEEYSTLIVDAVSVNNETVKNVYTKAGEEAICYKENSEMDSITLYEGDKEVDFSTLSPADVIRYIKSVVNGRTVIKAYKSSSKATGMVKAIRKYDGKTLISVGDVEYPLSPVYEAAKLAGDAKAPEIKMGIRYTLYLDDIGRVAYVSKAQDSAQYGIVVAKGTGGGFFAKEQFLKLYTADGTTEVFTLEEKVELNDENGAVFKDKAENIAGKILCGTDNVITVIAYRTNDEGKIHKIDLPDVYNDGNNGEFNSLSGQKAKYRTPNAAFDSMAFLDTNAVLWQIDGDKGDEESYSIILQSDLMGDHGYNFNCYNVDEFRFADMFVLYDIGDAGIQKRKISAPMLITEISTTLDGDGNEVSMITGMMGDYDSLSLLCEDDELIRSIRKGDTISPLMNSKGYLSGIDLHYSTDKERIPEYTPGDTIHSAGFVVRGKVIKNDVSACRMKVMGDNGIEYYLRTATNDSVSVWELGFDEALRGTLSDIETGDKVVVKISYSDIKGIVVYR